MGIIGMNVLKGDKRLETERQQKLLIWFVREERKTIYRLRRG